VFAAINCGKNWGIIALELGERGPYCGPQIGQRAGITQWECNKLGGADRSLIEDEGEVEKIGGTWKLGETKYNSKCV